MEWSKLWWLFVAYNSVMVVPCVLTGFLLAWGGDSAHQRMFYIDHTSATLEGLTFQHGFAGQADGTFNKSGGAILNWEGTLVVADSVFNENVSDLSGGAISSDGGAVSISDSTFSYNASVIGGAIYSQVAGPLTVTGSTFDHNAANYNGKGGAISASVPTTISFSTFSNNTADSRGGAIHVAASDEPVITYSTFENNSAGDGSGIYMAGSGDSQDKVTITNSTFSGNQGAAVRVTGYLPQAVIAYTTFWGNDVGIQTDVGAATVTSSVLANAVPGGVNCQGTIIDGSYNISDDASCGLSGDSAGPLLGPLADNGGPTETHALQAGSPAIDLIPISACAVVDDQRGQPRPTDGNGNGVASCDSGAYEADGPVQPAAPTNLSAVGISPTQITLAWTDNSPYETAFYVERSPDGMSGWVEVGSTPADVTSYDDTTVTCGVSYSYRTRAYRSGDNMYSGYSNVASATAPLCDPNLVRNPYFSADEAEWGFFGEIGHGVNGGVMEMYRQTPSPSGAAMWQVLGYAPPDDASFEVTLDIGNTSAVPKEMWVTLRQPDWSDFMTCYFSMAAGSPMASVTMYGHTQMAWSDMVLEIVPSPADSIPAIQIDNVTAIHRTDLTITETSCISDNLPPSGNLLLNPTFDTGTDNWTFWGEIGYVWNPGGDVSFWRETPSPFGAAIYQDLNYTTLANAPFEVTADLANDSDVTKDVWLTLRSPDWTDYFNCRFTLEPHAPMTNYTMRGRSTTGWSGIRLEIVPGPADSIPALRVDNVTVDHKPSLDTFWTECVRSSMPENVELVKNGDFSADNTDWYTWGDVERSVVGGVLNFWRTATITAGGAVIFQDLNVQTPAGAPFEVSLDLGNSSGVDKHMWVTLRNYDWSDYFTCFFELPAGAPLDTYTMRGETSIPWSNMRLELWAGPPDGVPALLADNISVQNNPALTPVGVECNVPGGAPGELVLEQPEITPTPEATVEPTIEPAILETVESDDLRVSQTGEWTTHTTDLASGGAYLFSSGSVDDTLSLSFSGTQLDVIYVKHPALGTFVVEIDGAVMQTVDSATEEAVFGARVTVSGLEAGDHVARIVPVSGTIAIDAFVVEAQAEMLVEPTPIPTEIIPTETPTAEPTPIPLPTTTPAEPLDTIESDDVRVVQSGLWTLTPGDLASGGTTLVSSGSVDDMLTLAFTGPRVDVVYVKHPALGTFTIEVDGAVLYTVTSAAEQNEFGAMVSLNGLGEGVHTLRIVPVSGAVAIDAFVVAPQGEIVPVVVPTEVVPTQTLPTAQPTATPVPTDVPPPATPEPTDVPPTVDPLPTESPATTPVGPSRPGVGS